MGYRAVLRNRNFVALLGLNVLFVSVGYEVFALLPAFAKNYADVSERWVGTIWLANTLLIVLIQLPVSKALEGRRRMVALALMNLLWAAASLIVLAAGAPDGELGCAGLHPGDARLRGRRDPPGPDPGAARGRPRAGTPARAVLRAQRDVLERGLDPRPRGRRAAARLASARRLVDLGRRLLFAAVGCLRLERKLPERVRRTPKPEPVTVTALTPPLDLATERL